jgi:hypothetical protein
MSNMLVVVNRAATTDEVGEVVMVMVDEVAEEGLAVSNNHRDHATVRRALVKGHMARARDRTAMADEDEAGDTIGVDISNDKKHHTKRSISVNLVYNDTSEEKASKGERRQINSINYIIV